MKILSIIIFVFSIISSCFAQSQNIYAHANIGMFSGFVQEALPRVYVPNTKDGTVSIINAKTYKVIQTIKTARDPEHATPSYDLKTIWILNDLGQSVTPINPKTSKPGKNISINYPYNLYFTINGKYAIVVNDEEQRLDFRNPHNMHLIHALPVHCKGLNHMDFSADGHFGVLSCEDSGKLVKIDIPTQKIVNYLTLKSNNISKSPMPQDVALSPNGKLFYIADMKLDGVFMINAETFKQIGFIKTGKGAHGITPSRNGQLFYVSNRGCNKMDNCPKHGPGSITVLDPIKQKIVAQWPIPRGGSPDMGNINADGTELWLSGKYDHEVYVFDTVTGKVIHRIPVGHFPHGLTVWPQPGRFSLGHTGLMR